MSMTFVSPTDAQRTPRACEPVVTREELQPVQTTCARDGTRGKQETG